MSVHDLKWSLVVASVLATGCLHGTEEVKLSRRTTGIPAAQGAVKTTAATNDNTRVIVQVTHLAPPARVENGATTYVVWAQPEGTDSVQNMGALKVDEKLKGSLTTVLPYENFRVFITAEPTAKVIEPTGDELLAATVRKRPQP